MRLLRLSEERGFAAHGQPGPDAAPVFRLNFDDPAVIGTSRIRSRLARPSGDLVAIQGLLRAVETLVSVDPSRNLALLLAPLRPHHLEDAGLYRAGSRDPDAVFQYLDHSDRSHSLAPDYSSGRRRAGDGRDAAGRDGRGGRNCRIGFIWKNNFERINVGQDRCYAIGEAAAELLAFCPDVPPPRTRIVGRDDPSCNVQVVRKHIHPG